MKIKVALMAATALSLSLGAVYAGDSNTTYVEQFGDTNSALIDLSNGPGGNDVGTAGDPVTQDGDRNILRIANGGCCNVNSRYDNDVLKAEQVGDDNWLNIGTGNLSNQNRINDVQQIGDKNSLLISHDGVRSSTIGVALQQGTINTGVIKQNGTGNLIVRFEQIGNDNGHYQSNHPELSSGRQAGSRVIQSGDNNKIELSSVVGDNNRQAATNTYTPPHDIRQQGDNNGQTASTASTLGSNGNGIKVTETGDWNNFSVMQGLSTASTGNYATVTQDGDFNGATVTQFGDNNQIVVDQDGNSNTATANFTGSGNGVGTLTGNAGTLAAAKSDLTQGTLFQDSSSAASGNTISYNVNGSNNLFAFAQIGGDNTITGNVGLGGVSNGNQVAVIQAGSSNISTFTQNGGSNNLSVSQ